MQISEIEYGAYLSYTSHPQPTSEIQSRSKNITIMLKNDATWPKSNQTTSEYIIQRMAEELDILPFADFFKSKPILVPIPKSSLMKQDSLWVPQRIATALIQRGLGSNSIECLKRIQALPKAASSSPENRPKAIDHYNSLSVETLSKADEILLVDDVVTRGATIIGAANRLADVFPNARIRAFAVIRTVTDPDRFTGIRDPCIGTIKVASTGETYRTPDSIVNL